MSEFLRQGRDESPEWLPCRRCRKNLCTYTLRVSSASQMTNQCLQDNVRSVRSMAIMAILRSHCGEHDLEME